MVNCVSKRLWNYESVVSNFVLVPDYLRTKYDPEIEESEQKLETMATSIPPDQAQVNFPNRSFKNADVLQNIMANKKKELNLL